MAKTATVNVTVIPVTQEQLAAALTEWDRRWREEPDRFLSEAEVLAQDPETYGDEAAPYLLSILREQCPNLFVPKEPA